MFSTKCNNSRTMNSEEIRSLYGSGLKKLIFENENSINALAHIAAEYQSYAAEVVSTIEEYIAKVDAKSKLCMLNLINCILQKVGGVYVPLFSENISIVFCKIFKSVDSDSRIKMYNLRKIWTDIFPAEKLYEIDFKANLLDPTWPITAQNPYLVHVNPKYLPQYSLLRIQDELLEKEKALLEVQEKKLQIEVLKVQIKLGRQISYTPQQTNEQLASENEHSGQCENSGAEKTQENTSSSLHTSPDQIKENRNFHITYEDSNDENLENVQQFDKRRLKLHQRHATPFALDTDGTYRNEYHIKPPNYAKSYEPAGRVRFGRNNNNGFNRKDQDDCWSDISQHDPNFLSFETEYLDSNATEQNKRHCSSLPHWNSFRQRKRGGKRFQFANYRDWKSNQWRNGRERFPAGRFQRKFRNFNNDRRPYDNAWKKRKSVDFDSRDCDGDLRNKLPNSNKEPSWSMNLSIGESKSSASAEKRNSDPPAQNSAGSTPYDRQNIENNLDACAITDIERELARIEEAFSLLEGRPDSTAQNLRETNKNAEEEDDSDFSEIYHVNESNESSQMDETEERFSRDNLEAFPTTPREANPNGFTSSIDGNYKYKPFTGTSKKGQINFKRLDKNKSGSFARKN